MFIFIGNKFLGWVVAVIHEIRPKSAYFYSVVFLKMKNICIVLVLRAFHVVLKGILDDKLFVKEYILRSFNLIYISHIYIRPMH